MKNPKTGFELRAASYEQNNYILSARATKALLPALTFASTRFKLETRGS